MTFDRHVGNVLGELSVFGDVLLPVRVSRGAADPARVSAAQAMKSATRIPPDIATRIGTDLDALGWEYYWPGASPGDDLSDTRTAGDPSGNDKVNSFLYVSLLYARYAQEIDGLNVIPPALSGLQLRAALQPDDSGLDEEALFFELAKIWNATPEGVSRSLQFQQPSFLPYLLTFDDARPAQLFERAISLRDDRDVRAYRDWLLEARDELADGKLSYRRRNQVKEAANILIRRLQERRADLPVTVGLQASADTHYLPAASIGTTVNAAALRDWLLALLPGRRYQKLLLRMAIAQTEQIAIQRKMKRLWDAA